MTTSRLDDLLQLAARRTHSLARTPASTYRIQFHAGFTFRDARAIVPYLAELGITHLYASPYLAAVAGSTHGYDVIDHDRLNPELGTAADYAELLHALAAHGLSHILDTVPNHVGVDTNDNRWWNSVLEHGRESSFAEYFDISWRGSSNPELHDRVLVPVLGEPYEKVLQKGQIKLAMQAETGAFVIEYFQRRFPISLSSRELIQGPGGDVRAADSAQLAHAVAVFNGAPGDPGGGVARMDALLHRQHYCLAFWRDAPREINYRRFFDINGLAALAMEREAVFVAAHAFTLRLAAQGKITGLRVDHPDGLYDPKEYFHRLQRRYLVAVAREIASEQPGWSDGDWKEMEAALLKRLDSDNSAQRAAAPLYVVAEKIVAFDEELSADWECNGTSGYDFLNMVNGLFIDQANERAFTGLYQSISQQTDGFAELAHRNKLLVLKNSFGSELKRLTQELQYLASRDRRSLGLSVKELQNALRELIACFPVYRTYIDSSCVSDADEKYLESAVRSAIDRNPAMPPELFHWVRDLLLQRPVDSFSDEDRARQLRFAARFQQLASPVMAKGVEDTAFYQYQRLVSLNEVGGEPARFGIDPSEVHRYLSARQQVWPRALNALSTHDTKRSEDVRARINVLSEIPAEWERHVRRWMNLNASHHRTVAGISAPAHDDEYLIYQTLVGAWPLEGSPDNNGTFIKRIQQFMQKAMREAKLRTNWTDPSADWESAVEAFISGILDRSLSAEFLDDFSEFARSVAHHGLINSLSQTLLRLAAPGVPDTYQGCELWDFSLVDPDNRRPVDFALRERLLTDLKSRDETGDAERAARVREMAHQMEDGRIKLWITRQALHCRRDHPELFSTGQYLPIQVTGSMSRHVFAFGRQHGDFRAICIVPRLVTSLAPMGSGPPLGEAAWQDTHITLPNGFENRSFENMFTGEKFAPAAPGSDASLLLSRVFASAPVALLLSRATGV